MPFGLTNAPSTFQALMNFIFKPLLRNEVLVFFEDILVYSKSWSERLAHLQKVLQLIQDNSLHANLKKCSFGASEIQYLGHIIFAKGVSTEPGKLQAVTQWPTPQNLKQLRGFLGLTGYYWRFIQGYGQICKPLTNLLKNEAFKWDAAAEKAFQELKHNMVQPPVLALPNFSKPFITSGQGMGAVLMQDGHPHYFYKQGIFTKECYAFSLWKGAISSSF
ncbi:putative mitochondrial protein AtMg00860 [Apium graveolens]|uniref:putative mitochondrial protein AtMg00860 n=1 Tax=Apium graveolens TaxID=4045 RepID=UPI003D7B4B0F